MIGLIIIASLILLAIIAVQIGKVSELSAKIRGEEEAERKSNKTQAIMGMVFMIGMLIFCVVTAYYYRNWMLGYGPHESASYGGKLIDNLFNITLIFTGIVFVATHILLFWFTYKYQHQEGRKAFFFPHNSTLEYIWTGIPAFVMFVLVIKGLAVWNEVMADVDPDEDYIEIEATGYQFAWNIRYPGEDGVLGTKNYKMITGNNPVGQDWNDVKNLDDFHTGSEFYLPVGKKVRVRITSRDVLHNFYLPHFRVKMDAVPGIPTYFVFTPETTTEEYRERLRNTPEYQMTDPDDPTMKLWESFEFELACAELCGKSHYSMRKILKVVEQEEYDAWLETQNSYYMSTIRNTDDDPHKGTLLNTEIIQRKKDFNSKMQLALNADTDDGKIIKLDYVEFETGSANLTSLSKYELDNVVGAMNQYGNISIELGGHTDSVGDDAGNMALSESRARAVYNYLTGKGIASNRLGAIGYGETRPIDSNDTAEGRQNNRRTELKIISQ